MINLIPSQEKKRMVRDFYYRLVATIFTMLSICALILVAAIFPSYFSAVLKRNIASEKLKILESEPLPEVDQEILKIMDDIKAKLNLVEKIERDNFFVSEQIIKEIISKKTKDIKITKISYDTNSTKGKSVYINGTAPSREELLNFRRILETSPSFKEVDLPISNFIKGTNIEFSLTLISS